METAAEAEAEAMNPSAPNPVHVGRLGPLEHLMRAKVSPLVVQIHPRSTPMIDSGQTCSVPPPLRYVTIRGNTGTTTLSAKLAVAMAKFVCRASYFSYVAIYAIYEC